MIDAIIYEQVYSVGEVETIVECDKKDNWIGMIKTDIKALENEVLFHIAAADPKYMSIPSIRIPNEIIEKIKKEISGDTINSYIARNNYSSEAKLYIQKQIAKSLKMFLNNFYEETYKDSLLWEQNKKKTTEVYSNVNSEVIENDIEIKRFQRYEIKKRNQRKKYYPFALPIEQRVPDNVDQSCPNCGSGLIYVEYGSSYQVFCEKRGCYMQP